MNPALTYEQILDYIDRFDAVTYAKTRNHLDGGVSKLSPYITRGVVSLPAVRDRLLLRYERLQIEKFIQELAWREYFQKVYSAKGEAIFSDLRFSRSDWRHSDIVTGIHTATTGITSVDEALRTLVTTGYMHNHARMWTAMLACNMVKAHWSTMSRWLYYHLLDGDLASNTLSWQWVAGTSVQKRYFANQSLINGCSGTSQEQTYLDVPSEVVHETPLPAELAASESFPYIMQYPGSDMVGDMAGKTVHLYHPWSIDPLWRKDEEVERIFILEPRRFDLFPVSPLVLLHMLTLLKTHVPTAKVYVGNVETIPGITEAQVFSKAHPATTYFPGVKDQEEELFPLVQGYYPSFFKFWQACQGES